jgi:hypothetical protein
MQLAAVRRHQIGEGLILARPRQPQQLRAHVLTIACFPDAVTPRKILRY